MIFFVELVGWLGSFIYILTYSLLSFQIIRKGKVYFFLNGVAAILIIIISFYKNTPQAIMVNVVWLVISFLGLLDTELKLQSLNAFVVQTIGVLFVIALLIVFIFFHINTFYNVLAWFSVYVFAGSYFLFTLNEMSIKSFHVYNFVAALTIVPKMIIFSNYQVVFLEIMWAFFALVAYKKLLIDK